MEKFKSFVTKRVIGGVLLTVFALWIFGTAIGFFNSPVTTSQKVKTPHVNNITATSKHDVAIKPIENAKSEKKIGADHVKPVKPALVAEPRPVAPSSRISPPEPVAAPECGAIAVG